RHARRRPASTAEQRQTRPGRRRRNHGTECEDKETIVTPFLQFRLWARRGPAAERAAAGVAALLALALLAWVLVPTPGRRTTTSALAAGTGGRSAPVTNAAGGTGAPTAGDTTA